ncbi:hypothetical protein BJX99DRAFT_271170 [Aspergillus californicus]
MASSLRSQRALQRLATSPRSISTTPRTHGAFTNSYKTPAPSSGSLLDDSRRSFAFPASQPHVQPNNRLFTTTSATSNSSSEQQPQTQPQPLSPLDNLNTTTHYTLFPQTLPSGPPPHSPFTINLLDLKREFLQLQSTTHPDKYPAGPLKARAEYLSATLNDAYRTLSDPLLRAQYILHEYHGIDVTAEDNSGAGAQPLDPELLMEVMDVQEAIEEVEGGVEGEREIEGMKRENEERIAGCVQRLEAFFGSGDVEGARGEAVRLNIINSVPFTFLVGPSHAKLTVQTGLARHVSRPLDHLMNSGQTRESKHQIAVLEDEDVETFVAFCEYAYTGDYNVPPPGLREDDREQASMNNPFKGMFSGDAGGSTPAAGLVQSPWKSAGGLNQGHGQVTGKAHDQYQDGDGDGEESRHQCQQSTTGDQAWYPSTEYPPGDPTATPRNSDGSQTPFADVSPSRGRRRHRVKADEQGAIKDPTSKLTPPCTPPGETRIEHAKQSIAESVGDPHDSNGGDQPTTQLDDRASSFDKSVNGRHGPGFDEHREAEGTSRSRARPVIDTSFANQEYSPGHENEASLWDEFTGIENTELCYPFSRARPSVPLPGFGLPYLIFHAKLYVFATRYLIPDLAHLCLRKLHRDLLDMAFPDHDPENQYAEQFVLTTTKARMIVDLLSYTYTKTTRLEPITPSSATQLRDNELRKLLVHYAACKVRDLAEYCPPMEPIGGSPFYPEKPSARGFRALLDTLPELASDLIYRMI